MSGVRFIQNAIAVAQSLTDHDRVLEVHYSDLELHRGHEVAKRQMRGFGGRVSFEVVGCFEAANRVTERLRP